MTANNKQIAIDLASGGFHVFPCQSGGEKVKQPMPFLKWREASTTDVRQINAWWQKWPDAAIGLDLAKSGLVVIDADRHSENSDGVSALAGIFAENEFLPISVPTVNTPNNGRHFFFRQPPGKTYGNGDGGQYKGCKLRDMGINIRGHGGYVLAPGTVLADGREYELIGDFSSVPVLPDFFSAILEKSPTIVGTSETFQFPSYRAEEHETPIEEIEELLTYVSASCQYSTWVEVLMGIHAFTGGSQEGFALADKWSSGGSTYKGSREVATKWRSFKSGGVTSGTIAKYAQEGGADLSAIRVKHMRFEQYDEVQAKLVSDMIRASFERRERAGSGSKAYVELDDGSLVDEDTGEVLEIPAPKSLSLPATQGGAYPPGLVGQIAKWISETARRPQPELSIGAALCVVGTLAGRQFMGPTESATHLYVLGLAPTGTGKDHPLQAIGRLMSSANLSQHIGPSEFISMPSVVNFLLRKPLSICAMDEFGSFMKRINGRNASGFESSISKVIRTMWSTSFAPYVTPEWAAKQAETIHCPSMSIFGASTPEQFYSAMEGAALEDGTLNRFLLINGRGDVAEVNPGLDKAVVPKEILADMALIYYRSGSLATTYRSDPHADPAAAQLLRKVRWCPDGAEARYMAFSAEMHKASQDSETGAFYARTAEMAVRIATIVAIGRLEDDQVRVSDMEYGIELALRSAKMMAIGAADYMSENQHQADAQKIMRAIKRRDGKASRRDLVQSLKSSIRTQDLNGLLISLCEGGSLIKEEVKRAGGITVFYRFGRNL